MALSYFTVTQPLYEGVTTSQAPTGQAPQVSNISGTVTFTPSLTEIESMTQGATVLLAPIVGRFNNDDGTLEMLNGTPGVELVDNVGLDLQAGQLTYRVDYSNVVFNGQQQTHMNSFRIAAPGDGSSINLNDPSKRLPV